jgi:hypothetical protein
MRCNFIYIIESLGLVRFGENPHGLGGIEPV